MRPALGKRPHIPIDRIFRQRFHCIKCSRREKNSGIPLFHIVSRIYESSLFPKKNPRARRDTGDNKGESCREVRLGKASSHPHRQNIPSKVPLFEKNFRKRKLMWLL